MPPWDPASAQVPLATVCSCSCPIPSAPSVRTLRIRIRAPAHRSFSLVARDLADARPCPCSTRSRHGHPGTRLGVVGPNGIGKDHPATRARGHRPARRGTVSRTPPRCGSATSRRCTTRDDETLLALPRAPPGVTACRRGARARRPRWRAGPARRATTPTPSRSTPISRRRPRLRRACRARCATTSGCPRRRSDPPTRALSGGQAARVSLAAILLSRFDVFLLDEPTNDLDFAGLERLEQFLDELPGGVVVVSHDRAFLDRTVTRVLELDEHTRRGDRVRRRMAGLPRRARHRPASCRGGLRRYSSRADQLQARARTQRQWSVQGVRKAKRGPRQRQAAATSASTRRRSRRRRSASARRRSTGSRRWRSRGRAGSCASTSRRRAAEWRRRRTPRRAVVDRGASASGRSTSRSAGPSGSRSSARTARARRRCSTPSSAASRSRPATACSGRAWSSASSTRRGRRSSATPRCSTCSSPRPGCRRRRPLAAREVRPRRRARAAPGGHAVAGRAHPGGARPLRGAGRELPRARRADEPPRPPRDRAARAGARQLRRDAAPRHPRPPRCSTRCASPVR